MQTVFTFAPDIPVDKEAVIQSRLSSVEHDHNVEFLFAIESGSRAWGFPSPDSDFDVRFVYAHKPEWYLSIAAQRDVIELPLEHEWDINGWDVKKAISLLLKPNPVLLEWLSSPIKYRWNETACQALLNFAERHVRPEHCLTHYFHLAKRQWERNLDGEASVNLKKYFYVLRPCLAIRWVRLNPTKLPPMNFQDLVNGTEISSSLQGQIEDLLRAKAEKSEMGTGERIADIDDVIHTELNWAQANAPRNQSISQETRAEADQLFRTLIGYTIQ